MFREVSAHLGTPVEQAERKDTMNYQTRTRLEELAAEIEDYHCEMESARQLSVLHRQEYAGKEYPHWKDHLHWERRLSECLIEAKALVPHGGYVAWIDEHYPGTYTEAIAVRKWGQRHDPAM
jgi:hypothetical protein